MEGDRARLIMIGSPFSSRVLALDPKDGSVRWDTELVERVSRPGRLVADIAFLATHAGSLLALNSNDGEVLWRTRTEKDNDFAAASPMFVDGSIYTLTEKGVLSRFSLTGERLKSREIDNLYNGRRVELVPMWRDSNGLSLLDQAGRLRTFNLQTLAIESEKCLSTAVGPGLDLLGSEVLGGIYSVLAGQVWTTELSGLLRASRVSDSKTLWTVPIGNPEDLYSEEGRVLAVPILSPQPNQKVLVVTRHRAWAFSANSGAVVQMHELPSAAVAPPLYDSSRKTWWVLTEKSLVELRWDGLARVAPLPIVDLPYTAALAGDLLVIGTSEGKIYTMSLRPIAD